MREHEQDGVNYHFLTVEEFTEKVVNGDMIEATNFNNWFYGTMLSTLSKNKINIGVFNPEAVEILQADKRLNVIVIYIEATNKERLLRQLNREDEPDCHEIVRRFKADEEDFNDDRINEIQPAFGIENHNDNNWNITIPVIIHGIYYHLFPQD